MLAAEGWKLLDSALVVLYATVQTNGTGIEWLR